jgi:hypothetical protein
MKHGFNTEQELLIRVFFRISSVAFFLSANLPSPPCLDTLSFELRSESVENIKDAGKTINDGVGLDLGWILSRGRGVYLFEPRPSPG